MSSAPNLDAMAERVGVPCIDDDDLWSDVTAPPVPPPGWDAAPWPDDVALVPAPTRAKPPPSAKQASGAAAACKVWTPAEVIASWRDEGPLVHEPTGLPRLDELTGGGPVYGTRWYVLGAPDAGKTALLVQMADSWARRGLLVGVLAVDEEPSDIVTRLCQRIRWTREDCEVRAASELDDMAAELPVVRIYDAESTIEAAAVDLAAAARAAGKRAALILDSLQTVSCAAEARGGDLSERARVTARVRAIRAVATRHQLIAVATSEMGRHAYRTVEASDAAKDAGDMASAKESGAIEYSARVMLTLRSVAGESDRVEVHIGKNKHRPDGLPRSSEASRGDVFFLALDRARMLLADIEAPAKPTAEDRQAAAEARGRDQLLGVAVDVVHVLAPVPPPGLGLRQLRAAVRARRGKVGNSVLDAAVAMLGAAVVLTPGARGAQLHRLERGAIAEDIRAAAGPLAPAASHPPEATP